MHFGPNGVERERDSKKSSRITARHDHRNRIAVTNAYDWKYPQRRTDMCVFVCECEREEKDKEAKLTAKDEGKRVEVAQVKGGLC